MPKALLTPELAQTTPRFRFAATVAASGQLLRGGTCTETFGYGDVLSLTRGARAGRMRLAIGESLSRWCGWRSPSVKGREPHRPDTSLREEKEPCPWEEGSYQSTPAPARTQSGTNNGHSVRFYDETEPGNHQAHILSAATAFGSLKTRPAPRSRHNRTVRVQAKICPSSRPALQDMAESRQLPPGALSITG